MKRKNVFEEPGLARRITIEVTIKTMITLAILGGIIYLIIKFI